MKDYIPQTVSQNKFSILKLFSVEHLVVAMREVNNAGGLPHTPTGKQVLLHNRRSMAWLSPKV